MFFFKLFLFGISDVALGDAVKDSSIVMHWTHYWRDIVTRHHVIIDGWPDNVPFKNLSDVSSSLQALESLLRKWESGEVFWKLLTDVEFKEMDLERDASIENGMTLESHARRTHSDKGKKQSRLQVHKQDGDTSEGEHDSSNVDSDVHAKKCTIKERSTVVWLKPQPNRPPMTVSKLKGIEDLMGPYTYI